MGKVLNMKTNTTVQNSESGSPREVFMAFLKLGLTSFGGPVAHIGYFRKAFVEQKQWLTESQFGQLLAICQFLPGPASSQLGFCLGLLRAGWLGALSAFVAFTLPSALLLIAFASLLPLLDGQIGQSLIHGLKLVACAVVADAVYGMAKKLCPDWQRMMIAIISALVLVLFGVSWLQLLVVFTGGMVGLLLCRHVSVQAAENIQVSYSRRFALIFFAVFVLLLIGLPMISSGSSIASVADIFYQAGALVFGGGHVVLPLLEESVVATNMVSDDVFLIGYGASQAIPGPMFAFAAYLGAMMPEANWLTPFIALAFMFIPGFLLILAVLPFWKTISAQTNFTHALAGLNAAVVGLLAAALYDPIITSGIASLVDVCIVAVALALLSYGRVSALWIVLWCVLASLVTGFI
jgi:chromate transporter